MPPRRPIAPDDIVAGVVLSDPRVSPDGTRVAFVVGEASREGPHFKSAIWVVPVEGDEPARPFTRGSSHDFAPRWSPDGGALAFLSDRRVPGSPQCYLIRSTGGEAEPLPAIPGEVKSLEWSPNGAMLAAIVVEPVSDEDARRAKALDDALEFGDDWQYAQLWTINLADQTVTKLTPAGRHAVSLAWSPDGTRIALLTQESPWGDAGYSPSSIDIHGVDGGAPEHLCATSGEAANLCWSPDGTAFAFRGPLGRVRTEDGIYIVSVNEGVPRHITEGYAGAMEWIAWSPDSQSLLAAAVEHEASALLRVPLEDGRPAALLPASLRGRGYVGRDVSFSANGHVVGLIRSTGNEPGELWVGPLAAPRRRTDLHAEVEDWAIGRVEPIRWTGAEGRDISGLLVYPAGYEAGTRYPLVLHIHGGPSWFWSDHFHAGWHDWAQYLASHGYAVLLPNPRGSTGRGAAFADSTFDDYGGKELEDSLCGVDRVVEMGIADAGRLGVGGWSHGGYMTAWAITQTNRFKAAVMGAGMCNLVSDQGQNDIPRCNDQYFSKRTYEDPEFFMERSPINFVRNISTPVLIVHGSADDRVNPMQGREFYIALRLLGRTCMHVSYPREKHNFEERRHQADLLRRVLEWYDRYLK